MQQLTRDVGCLGYVYPKLNYRYTQPMVAHDGHATTAATTPAEPAPDPHVPSTNACVSSWAGRWHNGVDNFPVPGSLPTTTKY